MININKIIKMKKYYEILGIKEGATKQDIKKAFNKQSKELDLKKNDNQDFFIEETRKLKEAYDKLMNISILSTKKVIDKSSEKEHLPSNETSYEKPNSNQKKKSFFSKENVILVLLIVLIGHSFYLQTLVSEATIYAKRASSNASDAASNASEATKYAKRASNNASDAASYASDAAGYAEDASIYAREASEYAFNGYYNHQ